MDTIIAKLDEMGFVNVRIAKPSRLKTPADEKSPADNPHLYIYSKIHTCPVCNMEFDNWALRTSKLRLNGTDLDLRPLYEPFDPLYYDVVMCPYCGYSAMNNYFYNLIASKEDIIREMVSPNFVYREYPMICSENIAIKRYLVALLCTLAKGAKNSERAHLCLKLSWINRDKKDIEQELLFQRYALAGFKAAHQEEEFPICGMDEPAVMYLLGELSRRAGDSDEAQRYISRALSARNIPARLRDKALTVKALIKEDKKKESDFLPFKKILKEILGYDL